MQQAEQAQQVLRTHPGLRVELDVTPRWFEPSLMLLPEDSAAMWTALSAYEGPSRALFEDLAIGLTGVRLVLKVLAGAATDAFEGERLTLKNLFDLLDLTHPRRARTTAQRKAAAEAQAQKAEQERLAREAAAQAEADRKAAEARRLEREQQEQHARATRPSSVGKPRRHAHAHARPRPR